MKKTFNIIGAVALGAAVLFGANSCNSSTSEKKENNVESQKDTTLVTTVNAEQGAATPQIVFVDMTVLLAQYQMAVDLGAEVQTKINEMEKSFENKKNTAEKEITKKQTNLQTKANDFQDKYSKGHLTETNANVKIQEIQKLEQEYNSFLAKKDQELGQEQLKLQNAANEEIFVMNNMVNDAINTFIQKYRVEKGYSMILVTQSDMPNDGATTLGNPVLAADPSLDITLDVLAGLNAEYNASK